MSGTEQMLYQYDTNPKPVLGPPKLTNSASQPSPHNVFNSGGPPDLTPMPPVSMGLAGGASGLPPNDIIGASGVGGAKSMGIGVGGNNPRIGLLGNAPPGLDVGGSGVGGNQGMMGGPPGGMPPVSMGLLGHGPPGPGGQAGPTNGLGGQGFNIPPNLNLPPELANILSQINPGTDPVMAQVQTILNNLMVSLVLE